MNSTLDKTLGELAELVGGELSGDANIRITGVSGLETAQEGDIVFVENEKWIQSAIQSPATAIIAPCSASVEDKPAIVIKNPRHAFVRILQLLASKLPATEGIDPSVRMGSEVQLGEGVSIGPLTVLGNNVKIGDNACVGPLCYIGDDTAIGEGCVLHAQVTIKHEVTLGSRVILHSGCVIGTDGFGYFQESGQHQKMPQIGTVIIHEDVEIGANTTIDRGTLGPTVVGAGTKIDNLVQVAHNVQIGKHCIICAQSGVSGSTVIGDGVVLGGQVGIGDHIKIGNRVVVSGKGGVISDLPEDALVSGYPAGPHREKMKVEAAIRRVPELLKTVRELKREVEDLSQKLALTQQR